MSKKINIRENGVLVGTGDLLYTPEKGGTWFVANCDAELGGNSAESDAAHESINEAINAGRDSVCGAQGFCVWTWAIYDAD